MRAILFLSDSVNRRYLDIYSQSGLNLPNLNRLAERSVIFDNHWTGSSPCMPARRDIMTGRYNFLDRGWGPIEPFDVTLPDVLRDSGVSTHIVTDHYHYFEIGGENYCQSFDEWELFRGQEKDPQMLPSKAPETEFIGRLDKPYNRNREKFYREEEKYPSVMTIDLAAQWLEENHDRENFFLWVEPFDPHEPFEVPEEYLEKLEDSYEGPLYIWPVYGNSPVADEARDHVRKRYSGSLMMLDKWLGKIFDVMDKYDMWEDTAFAYTTDHGYMLGEHGFMAKNLMPAYNEVFHIPLIFHFPGDAYAGMHVDALTQNIDLMPTLLQLYQAERPEGAPPFHGQSLLDLIEGRIPPRECILYGIFGKAINIFDGRYTYFRAPRNDNKPLYMYTAVPIDNKRYFDHKRVADISKIDMGKFFPWTEYPVYRIPAEQIQNKPGYALCFNHQRPWEMVDYLFDLENDYAQDKNIVDEAPEVIERLERMMAKELVKVQAPADHLVRMDLL